MSRPARAELDRGRIVAAAVGIVGREGVDGLTMRRLARRLGCAPMSLYRHVADKDELLSLVVEALASRMPPADTGAGWRTTVTQTFTGIWGLLRDHPGIAPHLSDEAVLTPAALGMVEGVLDALGRAGLDDVEAARAFATLWTFTLGAVLAEQSALAAQRNREQAERHRRAVARAVESAADVAYPRLEAVAPHWLELDPAASFAAGLDLLLDGIAARPGTSGRAPGGRSRQTPGRAAPT